MKPQNDDLLRQAFSTMTMLNDEGNLEERQKVARFAARIARSPLLQNIAGLVLDALSEAELMAFLFTNSNPSLHPAQRFASVPGVANIPFPIVDLLLGGEIYDVSTPKSFAFKFHTEEGNTNGGNRVWFEAEDREFNPDVATISITVVLGSGARRVAYCGNDPEVATAVFFSEICQLGFVMPQARTTDLVFTPIPGVTDTLTRVDLARAYKELTGAGLEVSMSFAKAIIQRSNPPRENPVRVTVPHVIPVDAQFPAWLSRAPAPGN